MLKDKHPGSKNMNVQVHFTDTYDMEGGDTETCKVLRKIYTYAGTQKDFDCKQIEMILDPQWDKKYQDLMTTF